MSITLSIYVFHLAPRSMLALSFKNTKYLILLVDRIFAKLSTVHVSGFIYTRLVTTCPNLDIYYALKLTIMSYS